MPASGWPRPDCRRNLQLQGLRAQVAQPQPFSLSNGHLECAPESQTNHGADVGELAASRADFAQWLENFP